jgi:hypothetical protein
MGNCNKKDQAEKPSKQKKVNKEPVSKILIMTFAGQNCVDLCLPDSQPPTFSDPNYFSEPNLETSAASDTSVQSARNVNN